MGLVQSSEVASPTRALFSMMGKAKNEGENSCGSKGKTEE